MRYEFVYELTSGIKEVAALSGGGFVTISCSDHEMIIWSNAGKQVGSVLTAKHEPIRSVIALSNGCFLTEGYCSQRSYLLWSPDGQRIKEINSIPEGTVAVPNGCNAIIERFPDGRIVSFPDGRIFNRGMILSPTGKRLTELQVNQDEVWCVKILPNGDILTGGRDGKVRLWTVDMNVLMQATSPWKRFKSKKNAKESNSSAGSRFF